MSDREEAQIAGVIAAIKKFQKGHSGYNGVSDNRRRGRQLEAIAFTDIYRNSLELLKRHSL